MNESNIPNSMRLYVFFFSAFLLSSSCSFVQKISPNRGGNFSHYASDGMLHAYNPRGLNIPVTPLGMVYVPSGINVQGNPDETYGVNLTQKQKVITLEGFWMDATEISNNQYRHFVNYCVDSTIAKLLGIVYNPNDSGEEDEASDSDDASIEGATEVTENLDELVDSTKLPIDWNRFYNSREPLVTSENRYKLDPIYYSGDDILFNQTDEINYSKIQYRVEYLDYIESVKYKDSLDVSRSRFIVKEDVKIYPDTTVWMSDFVYSYNEPIARKYFGDISYGNYPVVGVNWIQASAFCQWRTQILNEYRVNRGINRSLDYFRLPTQAEWEYASRGGRVQALYPWGSYYLRNKRGCLLANFKPGRGNYPEDGGVRTTRVDSYWPNDFGLYNMSGNVSEWTESVYYEGSDNLNHDLNPTVSYNYAEDEDPVALSRKVVRGGSWKDVGYFLQVGLVNFEYADISTSYIGFRCVASFSPPPSQTF